MLTKQILRGLLWAAIIVISAFALRYAASLGWLGEDGARRGSQIVIGFFLAALGNNMPKDIGNAPRSPAMEACAQSVLRVGGWSFMLAGLAYAGLWAFAPMEFVKVASISVVLTAMTVTVVHAVWAFNACRRSDARSA